MTMKVSIVERTDVTPDSYWLKDIEYGIRTRIYQNSAGGWQEDTTDNAGWMSCSGARPRPLPDTDDREANEAYANRNGYFWLKCRRCGEMRGGHETERNRACERRYRARIHETLKHYDHPLETASVGLMTAETDKLHLAELASSKHFRFGVVAFGCPCGTAQHHDAIVAALSYRLWTGDRR